MDRGEFTYIWSYLMHASVPDFESGRFLTFLEEGSYLSGSAIRRAETAARQMETSAERVVVELGLLGEAETYAALAAFLDLEFITIDAVDRSLLRSTQLDPKFLARASALPVKEKDGVLIIATSEPDMADLLGTISYEVKAKVNGAIIAPSTVTAVLQQSQLSENVDLDSASQTDVARLQALANDGPIIAFVNDMIGRAVAQGASDIHFEAAEQGARIRFRIDGVLSMDRTITDDMRGSVASRLKIMANLNISEKRRPQDGRTDVVVRGRPIDIRLSCLPTQYGESIVMRLLDKNRTQLDWAALHMPQDIAEQIDTIMLQPNGIFLVAGPTGSGKTTTLYTALKGINTEDRKIVTVEDPIEYAMAGINQVQVDNAIDMSFARALRAILRQDPNVVMVGEIRDEETAEIAVRAALMGRLVVSTIHTNDSVGAIDRLLDLKVPPYLVGATLRGVLSQRLVRTLCSVCRGGGCKECSQSGQKGRMAICELLQIDEELGGAIASEKRGADLREMAKKLGFVDLNAAGEKAISMDLTTEQEIFRALGSVEITNKRWSTRIFS